MSARRAAAGARRSRTRRWPVLVLIPLLIVAAVAVQRHEDDQPAEVATVSARRRSCPSASAPDAPSSTWYCAGGTATGDQGRRGRADRSRSPTLSDQDLTARLTAVPSEGDAGRARTLVPGPQPAVGRCCRRVVVAPYASAVVEVRRRRGRGVPRADRPDRQRPPRPARRRPRRSWYFPSGDSAKASATRQLLAAVQPVPERGRRRGHLRHRRRRPGAAASSRPIVVPGNSVAVLDVSDTVTLRTEIATTVSVRSGRVIADQIQMRRRHAGHDRVAGRHPGRAAGLARRGGSPTARPARATRPRSRCRTRRTTTSTSSCRSASTTPPSTARRAVRPSRCRPGGRRSPTSAPTAGCRPASATPRSPPPPTARPSWPTGSPPSTEPPARGHRHHGLARAGAPGGWCRWRRAPTVTSAAVIVTNPSSTDPVTVTVSSVADGAETPITGRRPDRDRGRRAAGLAGAGAGRQAADRGRRASTSAPVVVEARLAFKDAGLAAAAGRPGGGLGGGRRPGPPGRPPDDSVTARPERHRRPERPGRRRSTRTPRSTRRCHRVRRHVGRRRLDAPDRATTSAAA